VKRTGNILGGNKNWGNVKKKKKRKPSKSKKLNRPPLRMGSLNNKFRKKPGVRERGGVALSETKEGFFTREKHEMLASCRT